MKIDFTPDPSLYPFEPHWFDGYAGQMHYVDEGDGPPILFCHGNPTWSFLYRNIITRLRGRFRCIHAVDMTRLNSLIPSWSAGQNQVLPRITPRTRSARAVAAAMLTGPPQSWPIVMNPSSWRRSASSPTQRACSSIV